MINLPVLLYNIKIMVNKEFLYGNQKKINADTDIFKRNLLVTKFKLAFYIILVVVFTVLFLAVFSSMVVYRYNHDGMDK